VKAVKQQAAKRNTFFMLQNFIKGFKGKQNTDRKLYFLNKIKKCFPVISGLENYYIASLRHNINPFS